MSFTRLSATPPPVYEDNATDTTRFTELIAYASTHGTYLLQDSQYQLFAFAWENDSILCRTLTDFTIPFANANVRAVRRLRSLQIINLRQANRAYDHVIEAHPHLLERMQQPHYSGQRDSPSPMRILSPPPFPPSRRDTIVATTNTNQITRTNQRQRPRQRCFKCHQTSHIRQDCPRYRCMNCHRLRPGHLTNNCPDQTMSADHEYDFGHDYDPDDNLNGEQ
jgi:hypothetical protein